MLLLVYFIKKGRMKMMIDVNEDIDDEVEDDEELNVGFICYPEGSYFGDHDIFF